VFLLNKRQLISLVDVLVLDKVGTGGSRDVYLLNQDIEKVVKIERSFSVQNTIEYELWCQFSETLEGKKWLARCYSRSDDGVSLVQERLEIIISTEDKRLPEKVPRFFTDLKVTNWGVDTKGNVKCCDYGSSILLQNNPWQLKKADWWEMSHE